MPLYANQSSGLSLITEESFALEKEIQRIVENNIEKLLGLELVASEFKIQNFRLDSLAYDRSLQSFVIIEYKKDKNFSVIDQGYAYLSFMLNNKSDFILEYNESKNRNLKRGDIDWSQSRIIFVSPQFTTYQKQSLDFKDIPIEIWEIKKYSNNTVSFQRIQNSNAQVSINTVSGKDENIQTVTNQVKIYTEEDHLKNKPDEVIELYNKLKMDILNLDVFTIEPKKEYIAFKAGSNIVDICIQKNRS